MSYNNYLDGDAAFSAVSDIPQPACVIVKHTNPCGAATREDLREAYRLAVRADPVSAFGGIVVFNRFVTLSLAQLRMGPSLPFVASSLLYAPANIIAFLKGLLHGNYIGC